MEQSKLNLSFTYKALLFLLLNISTVLLISCKKEEPNPELRDPIYQDLVKLHKTTQKELEDAIKAIDGIKKDLNEAPPRSIELKSAQKALSKNKKKIRQLEQLTQYYEIRKEHRRVVTRRNYRIAFKNEQDWPDPREYTHYQTNKRLRAIDKNWQSRVPKLFKDNPNYIPGPQTGKDAKK